MARLSLLVMLLVCTLSAHGQMQGGVELVNARLVADRTAIVPGETFRVGLHLRMAPHWHTYWRFPGDSGMATRINWTLPAGFRAGEIQWPLPNRIVEEGDLHTYAYEDEVLLIVEITAPAKIDSPEVNLSAKAEWLVCEKICIPGEAGVALKMPVASSAAPANEELFRRFTAQLPEKTPPPFELTWEKQAGALVLRVSGLQANQQADFFPVPPQEVLVGHPESKDGVIRIPVESGDPAILPGVLVVSENGQRLGWNVGDTSAAATAMERLHSLWTFLLLGALGGFILNLMPCVLPVIALKIFGFIKQAGETPERIWRLGLAFVAGIFAWFLLLAVLVAAFKLAGRELNWAFQFQHPVFIVVMMLIIFVFALNLLGLFEITLPGRTHSTLAEISAREGYGGAFLHGVFATLMATPCTAPFLGPALGFAFAQSTAVIFAMFTAIAAGMAFPYLLLSARPGWLRYMPKPGMWMVRLKQAMGVLLVGTCVWLGWVLWQQQGEREPFQPQFEKALAGNQTVFVDFTADWCINCKVNERLVLDSEPVQRAFREKDVLFLKADWTNGDPNITRLLRSFGRAGVPLYVVYPAGRRNDPIVLPELLNTQLVLEALEKAQPRTLSAR